MFNNYNFGKGIVEKYIDFDVNTKENLLSQLHLLKEDLIQIKYINSLILDVGWYPEFNKNGHFIIYIIQNYDWEKPKFKKNCTTLEKLDDILKDAINFISSTVYI